MRRFLLAAAALLVVSASPAFAGYIIIRVLLEGGTPGPGGVMGPGGPAVPIGPGPGGRPDIAPGIMPGPGGPVTVGTEIDHSRGVVIVVPLETDFLHGRLNPKGPINDQINPDYRKLTAPYYNRLLKSSLFVDSSTIQLYQDLIAQPAPRKSRGTEMREKYAAWLSGKKTDPQLLYDALTLALESGFIRARLPGRDGTLPPDATKIAQELLDLAAEKKLLPPAAERFVKAWAPIAKDVKVPAPQPSAAEDWKARLDATNVRTEGHYSVIYWDNPEGEVIRRSAQLNDNFTAFYLLHATRGITLPVPNKPFVTVLARQGSKFLQLRTALDGLPSQTDAFYAPEHDLLVLSPELMDAVGLTFQRQNQQYFAKGFSRDRLLNGEIPKLDALGRAGPRAEDIARASTLALVEKLVVEDAEVTAVSREGTRQLLFATGLLPKHVTLPNWLTQGALNFYTRPRGPAYVAVGDDDKPFMTVAFTTGYGVPNYVNQRYFRDLDAHKELNADRVKLLEHVLTDAYFTGLKTAVDPDPAPPVKKKKTAPKPAVPGGEEGAIPVRPVIPMGPMVPGAPGTEFATDEEDPLILQRRKRDRLNVKSQATAWALYYYLARARSSELNQYISELNKLPRDLPIDGRTAYDAFVRVFKLSTAEDGTPDPDRMRKFASDWLDYLTTVPAVGHDIPLIVPDPMKDMPMGPTGPGGFVPPPGGRER